MLYILQPVLSHHHDCSASAIVGSYRKGVFSGHDYYYPTYL